MKAKKFVFDLDSKVAIYVPTTNNAVEACDNSEMVKRVLMTLSNLFGGATATDAVGGWVSTEHGLITERVTIIYSFCKSEAFASNIDAILELCETIKNEMNQEAVTLEYNGQVKFI